ncbi:MAG: PFL_4669 family integrating conjugative element protein, partial [Burkholderiales bacterium]
MTTDVSSGQDVQASGESGPGLRAPVATDRGLVDTPGALRSEVWLTLQTRHAQRIFTGRRATPEKPYIIGLTRFGAILSQLQVCVYADDPYADWWLIKVEEALARSAEEIKILRHTVEEKLKSTPAIEVQLATSLLPIRVPLQFRNPFAYSAARMLADVDTLVRAVLTARHIGLMDRREGERCVLLGARALRRAMGTALGYRYEGVKRQDIREGNAQAQKARERMGEAPAEVVDGSRRARYAPEKRSIKQLSGGSVVMRPGGLVERWGMP